MNLKILADGYSKVARSTAGKIVLVDWDTLPSSLQLTVTGYYNLYRWSASYGDCYWTSANFTHIATANPRTVSWNFIPLGNISFSGSWSSEAYCPPLSGSGDLAVPIYCWCKITDLYIRCVSGILMWSCEATFDYGFSSGSHLNTDGVSVDRSIVSSNGTATGAWASFERHPSGALKLQIDSASFS